MKVRIIDIAQKAGVSVGTVDRIIHQRGKVSKKVNEKVQRVIQELGYEPDILARNLALKKEIKIVCLLPNPKETKYWERPDSGIDKAIAELSSFKINIEKIYFSLRVEDFKKACMQVISIKPDGVIYAPVFGDESLVLAQKLNSLNTPFIHINIFHPEAEPLTFIGQDPFAAGQVAASMSQMCLRKGQEILIAIISKKQQEYSHLQSRIEGFMQFFENEDCPKPVIHHLNINVGEDERMSEQLLSDFFTDHPDIKIIYVPNSRAYLIASMLKKTQNTKKIVIGFDTIEENVQFLKEGTIDILIGQQSKYQGHKAVHLIFDAIFKKEHLTNTHYLPIDILNKHNVDFYEGLL